VIRARGIIARADTAGFLGEDAPSQEHLAHAHAARALLESEGDDLGLAQYWRVHGYSFRGRLQAAKAREDWERALDHAVKAGASRLEVELRNYIMSAVVLGPTPVSEALPYAEQALESAPPASLSAASAMRAVAMLSACRGLIDEARRLHEKGRAIVVDAGLLVTAGGWAMGGSEIEWRAGDLGAQERLLRDGVESLDRLGDHFFYSTVALRLADCLLHTRSPDDAEVAELCAKARERSLVGDLVNFVYLDAIDARRLAYDGSAADAADLARRAVDAADTTDNFDVRGSAWASLAETLVLAGDLPGAGRAAAESMAIRAAKGDVSGVEALERGFAELGVQPA
jgi:hypothetical protein